MKHRAVVVVVLYRTEDTSLSILQPSVS